MDEGRERATRTKTWQAEGVMKGERERDRDVRAWRKGWHEWIEREVKTSDWMKGGESEKGGGGGGLGEGRTDVNEWNRGRKQKNGKMGRERKFSKRWVEQRGWREREGERERERERALSVYQTCMPAACFYGNRHLKQHWCINVERLSRGSIITGKPDTHMQIPINVHRYTRVHTFFSDTCAACAGAHGDTHLCACMHTQFSFRPILCTV